MASASRRPSRTSGCQAAGAAAGIVPLSPAPVDVATGAAGAPDFAVPAAASLLLLAGVHDGEPGGGLLARLGRLQPLTLPVRCVPAWSLCVVMGAFAVVAADPRRRMLRGSLAGRKKDPRECRFLPGDCRGELAADRSRAPVGGESAASAALGEVSYGDADSSVRQDHRESA